MSSQHERLLDQIRGDREHGATAIALHAASLLEEAAEKTPADDLADLAERVRRARPAMAPVVNAAHAVLRAMAEDRDPRDAARAFRERLEGSASRIAERAVPELAQADPILLLSWSGTVAEVVDRLEPRSDRRLVVCESRPGLEGRRTARAAAAAGHRVIFGTDAAAGGYLEAGTAFLSGADALLEDGSFVNKVGSHLLACGARDAGGRVLVVAASAKERFGWGWHHLDGPDEEEAAQPGEIWRDAPSGIEVRNPTFETVPARLVSRIVTDR